MLLLGLSGCASIQFYQMSAYDFFCVNCGKVSLDCKEAFKTRKKFVADEFEFPVGSPSGSGFYIAQSFGEKNPRFRERRHTGEDWNYRGGGDSDYGAPVYSVGNGIVTQVDTIGGGWGKVIRVCHKVSPRLVSFFDSEYLETVYAHLYGFKVVVGEEVIMGQWIGSIGDADGKYTAHLHFEVRNRPGENLGGGYSSEIPDYYVHPIKFLSYFQKRIAY